jgi:hypothetical protein
LVNLSKIKERKTEAIQGDSLQLINKEILNILVKIDSVPTMTLSIATITAPDLVVVKDSVPTMTLSIATITAPDLVVVKDSVPTMTLSIATITAPDLVVVKERVKPFGKDYIYQRRGQLIVPRKEEAISDRPSSITSHLIK